jgi:hypothetical protein
MKRIILVSALALAVLVAFVPISNAETANEGSLDGTITYAGKHKIIPLDKGRFVIKYENFGVRLSDSGEGPLHGMSTHNTGVIYFENGIGKTRGYIIFTDKDGDKMIMELNEDAAQMSPKPSSGTGKIIGGTGKFQGIQGSMEYTRRNMRPAADGTHQAVARGTGTWKIVEPKK